MWWVAVGALALACCGFCMLINWLARKNARPIPDYGGKIITIHSVEEWNASLGFAAASGQHLLVDCYANWCPPCRAAAPVYAQLSREYFRSCVFAKVDVDRAPDVARLLNIHAMPTFALFGAPAHGCPHMMQLASIRGWREAQVRHMLESNGCERCEPEPDSDDADADGSDADDQPVTEQSKLVGATNPSDAV